MPSTEKVQKSSLTGTIDSFLDRKRASRSGQDARAEGDVDFLNIIDFIDRFKLLPNGLYPVQKFILKLYYDIPLSDVLPDDANERIRITDRFGVRVLHEMTEVQYLRYIFDQGRCNIREQDLLHSRKELVLVLGRRAGKSALSAIIASYEIYKLLARGHPQAHYGIPTGSEIRILCVANDKEQASIVYGDISGYIDEVDYFKSALSGKTQTFLRFQTDSDKKKNRKASIVATFKSSIAKGLRGRGIMAVILDELAFFVDDGNSSAERIYKAIVPSISQFSPKDPKNRRRPVGPSDGRVISISSPDAREGFFYRLYQLSLTKGLESSNMLMIQAPTWEVNPTLDRSYYEIEYHKDPKSFATEHGAEFSDRVRGWIEDRKDLLDCVVPTLRPMSKGSSREPFWAGVDFGIVNDGTAIALTRMNGGKIELAYHEVWYAKKKWKESNPHLDSPVSGYAMRLQDVPRLDITELAEWFKMLCSRFYIVKGVFDQWAGPIFEQELHKRGLTQFEMRHFSVAESSQMFQTFKMLMFSNKLSMYDHPIPESVTSDMSTRLHSPIVSELLELQATSGGKNITVVEAPDIAGKHDDVSDAFARSVLLASEHIRDYPGALESSGTRTEVPGAVRDVGYRQFHRMRARLHGRPDKNRTVPGGFRRR